MAISQVAVFGQELFLSSIVSKVNMRFFNKSFIERKSTPIKSKACLSQELPVASYYLLILLVYFFLEILSVTAGSGQGCSTPVSVTP
jgi:hypothetical protein